MLAFKSKTAKVPHRRTPIIIITVKNQPSPQVMIKEYKHPKAIVDVWEVTADIFKENELPLTKQTLETLVEEEQLTSLLQELNAAVGSSAATCIEGG